MQTTEAIRVWLCDCERIHVEGKHYRWSFTPAEFLKLLRAVADAGGALHSIPPAAPSHPSVACYRNEDRRTAHLTTKVARL
jgi:hypothetical protein